MHLRVKHVHPPTSHVVWAAETPFWGHIDGIAASVLSFLTHPDTCRGKGTMLSVLWPTSVPSFRLVHSDMTVKSITFTCTENEVLNRQKIHEVRMIPVCGHGGIWLTFFLLSLSCAYHDNDPERATASRTACRHAHTSSRCRGNSSCMRWSRLWKFSPSRVRKSTWDK